MRLLDLFSGIGGFALGARWAGLHFDQHYYSEINKHAIKIYQRHFPEAVNLGDITRINTEELPKEDWIICGGFPCQDISSGGPKTGINSSRSGLYWEMYRLISELSPRLVVLENVPPLTHSGLERVVCSLAEVGYDCEWENIRASQFGLPHKRERIFIVAYPHSDRQLRLHEHPTERPLGNDGGISPQAVTPPNRDQWALWLASRAVDAQPLVARKNDGLPRQLDWKPRVACLGNAVSPLITAEIFSRCRRLLEGQNA